MEQSEGKRGVGLGGSPFLCGPLHKRERSLACGAAGANGHMIGEAVTSM